MVVDKRRQTAFSGSLQYGIESATYQIAKKLYKLRKPEFTPYELRQLFVEPEYHESLTQAFRLNRGAERTHTIIIDVAPYNVDVTLGQMAFEWNHVTVGGFFPVHRRDLLKGPLPTCPPELRDKFTSVVEALIMTAYDWGLVRFVFNELNQSCTTAQQVRFVWPSILELIRQYNPRHPALASLAQESSRAGDRAKIPPSVQYLIRTSYEIVTKSIFLLDHDPPDVSTPITYRLNGVTFRNGVATFAGLV